MGSGIIQAGREPKKEWSQINGAIEIILEDRVPLFCMVFTVKGSEVFVTDLCAKIGLLRLNGAKLVGFKETRLTSGDVIEIGHTRMTFQEIASEM